MTKKEQEVIDNALNLLTREGFMLKNTEVPLEYRIGEKSGYTGVVPRHWVNYVIKTLVKNLKQKSGK